MLRKSRNKERKMYFDKSKNSLLLKGTKTLRENRKEKERKIAREKKEKFSFVKYNAT